MSFGPNDKMCARTRRMMDVLAGYVVTILHPDNEVSAEETSEGLLTTLTERTAAVQGNRPDDAPISWADERLWAAAVLRTLLEELEEAPCP